jgi:hypothetical protein
LFLHHNERRTTFNRDVRAQGTYYGKCECFSP